ncbi:MAG: hypothetical protein QNJ54_28385 [Prochloraceae cyanobacterium]|nr:hypothetical protein [Prochloraceae cyanobacterium]
MTIENQVDDRETKLARRYADLFEIEKSVGDRENQMTIALRGKR